MKRSLTHFALALAGAGIAIGCVPPRGGWDIDALRRERPAIAALEGERLGDMVPFPALALDEGARGATERVALVACRFAAPSEIRVRTNGPGWSEASGGPALAALTSAIEPAGLALRRVDAGAAEIGIDAFLAEGPELPEGLGDTLVECDVAPRAGAAGTVGPVDAADTTDPADPADTTDPLGVRGRILRAEVRMRRSGRDAAGRIRVANDAEWTGALLHELGHALGYAGHAATGESIFVRDEFELRAIGRDVLRGKPLDDSTLRALLELEPGQALGARQLRAAPADWVRAVRALDRAWLAAGGARVAVVASVGDREARWSIRYADGRHLGLRFPGWPERLREGREILVFPDRETLAAIRGSIGTGGSREGVSP